MREREREKLQNAENETEEGNACRKMAEENGKINENIGGSKMIKTNGKATALNPSPLSLVKEEKEARSIHTSILGQRCSSNETFGKYMYL